MNLLVLSLYSKWHKLCNLFFQSKPADVRYNCRYNKTTASRHLRILHLISAAVIGLTLLAAGCAIPEDIEEYQEMTTSENRCPIVTNQLPEKNIQVLPENETVLFIINITDPDGDPIDFRFTMNGEDLVDPESPEAQDTTGRLRFSHLYRVNSLDFVDNEFVEFRAYISDIPEDPDQKCTLPQLDWSIGLLGG